MEQHRSNLVVLAWPVLTSQVEDAVGQESGLRGKVSIKAYGAKDRNKGAATTTLHFDTPSSCGRKKIVYNQDNQAVCDVFDRGLITSEGVTKVQNDNNRHQHSVLLHMF